LDSQDTPARRQTASEEAVGAGADELKPSPDTLIRHRSSPSGTTKQSDEKRALSRAEPSASSTWATLWPLLVVLTLIGAIAYVIKRFTPARRMLTGAGVVDIVARTPVSAKQSLVLAKMGQRLVLIGVCPDRITALAHVDDPDEAALLLGQAASGREDSISHQFVHAFREQASAYAEPDDDEDQMRPPAGSVRSLLERVRQLAKKRGVA
jgi:flagellar biogenesis protein FliO